MLIQGQLSKSQSSVKRCERETGTRFPILGMCQTRRCRHVQLDESLSNGRKQLIERTGRLLDQVQLGDAKIRLYAVRLDRWFGKESFYGRYRGFFVIFVPIVVAKSRIWHVVFRDHAQVCAKFKLSTVQYRCIASIGLSGSWRGYAK